MPSEQTVAITWKGFIRQQEILDVNPKDLLKKEKFND